MKAGGGEDTAGQPLTGRAQVAAGRLESLLRSPTEVRLLVGDQTAARPHRARAGGAGGDRGCGVIFCIGEM